LLYLAEEEYLDAWVMSFEAVKLCHVMAFILQAPHVITFYIIDTSESFTHLCITFDECKKL
jgi:hypothetical protein